MIRINAMDRSSIEHQWKNPPLGGMLNQGSLQNGFKCLYSWQGKNGEGKWDGRFIFLSNGIQ
jgi:hypothetical protein